MKKFSLNSFSAILTTIFICFGLGGCENFLNNKQVKQEIIDSIDYNNAPVETVAFEAAQDMGSFLSSDVRKTFKVGYPVQVQFSVNTKNYIYKGLKAFSKNDRNKSLNEIVKFEQISADEQNGIYVTEIKITKKTDGIIIMPDCTSIPKISSITPALESSGCDQDTPIKFTFNKAINPQSFAESAKISIYSDTDSLTEKFLAPCFLDENTVLCIRPGEERILAPGGDRDSMSIFVNYDFTKVLDADGLSLNLSGTYEYRIRKEFSGQQKVKIYAQGADGVTLSLNQGQYVECTIGYTADIVFSLDNSNYEIKELLPVSYTSPETNLSNIEVNAIPDENVSGKYKASVWVKDETDDVLLKIETFELPAVDYTKPDYSTDGVTTDKAIKIHFNTPMEDAVKGHLRLEINGSDVSRFFPTKEWNEDRTLLKITPDYEALKNFIVNEMKSPYADVSVYFDNTTTAKIGDKVYYLKQDSKSRFTVRYKNDYEANGPVMQDFFVTSFPITLKDIPDFSRDNAFIQTSFNLSYNTGDQRILSNFSPGVVYIYGCYKDEESGLYSVSIYEEMIRDSSGNTISNSGEYTHIYEIDSDEDKNIAEFKTDENGNTFFCIKHMLQASDLCNGVMNLSVYVDDVCCNVSDDEPSVLVFVKTDFARDFEYILPYNYSGQTIEEGESITVEEYNNRLKTIKLPDIQNLGLYGNVSFDTDSMTRYCEYIDKDDILVKQKFENYEIDENGDKIYYTVLDVNSVDDLEINIIFSTDNGIYYEQYYSFPPSAFLINEIEIENYTEDQIEKQRYIVTPDFIPDFWYRDGYQNVHAICQNEDGTGFINNIELIGYNIDFRLPKENTKSYYFFNDFDGLCGELKSLDYLIQKYNTPVESVEKSYEIVYDSDNQVFNLTIQLASDVWEKFDVIWWERRNSQNYIGKGTYTLNFQLSVDEREYDQVWSIHGISSCKYAFDRSPVIIPPLTQEDWMEYDNIKPVCSYGSTYENNILYLVLKANDNQTGVDYARFYDGNKTYTLANFTDKQKKLSIPYPYEDFKETTGTDSGLSYVLNYEAGDKKGNITTGSLTLSLPVVKTLYPVMITGKNTIKIQGTVTSGATASQQRSTYQNIKFDLYKISYDDETKSWITTNKQYSNIPLNQHDTNYDNCWHSMTIDAYSFYKIVGTYNSYKPIPLYHYAGEQNSGEYDILLANGTSNSSVSVASDAPVFVHTLVTKKPYSVCSTWSIEEWEQYRRELNPVVISFSKDEEHTIAIPAAQEGDEPQTITYTTGDHSPKRYNIPVGEINSKECYCVIAYFADGTYIMSQVMQK